MTFLWGLLICIIVGLAIYGASVAVEGELSPVWWQRAFQGLALGVFAACIATISVLLIMGIGTIAVLTFGG